MFDNHPALPKDGELVMRPTQADREYLYTDEPGYGSRTPLGIRAREARSLAAETNNPDDWDEANLLTELYESKD